MALEKANEVCRKEKKPDGKAEGGRVEDRRQGEIIKEKGDEKNDEKKHKTEKSPAFMP